MTDTNWSEWIDWNATEDSVCPLKDGTLHQVISSDGNKSFVDGSPETWAWNAEELSITAYRYELADEPAMPSDLEHLARTVPEWNGLFDRVGTYKTGVVWFNSDDFPDKHGYTEDQLLQTQRDLGLVSTEGEDEAFDVVEQKQARYQDATGEDWIDEAARTFTAEEFRGAMRFSIGKYNRRMGKKDELIKEIEKMKDYCQRWIDVEEGR
jgi:hypothetical protein